LNPAEISEVLAGKGAILRGHFVLSSGRHSDTFVQKFRIFEHPKLTEAFGEALGQEFGGDFDVVASPAVGALVLGFATALAADARFVFAEREEDALSFRRGFVLRPRERVLVVEDVITTGGSAREVVELVRSQGAQPVGIGALIDRSDPSRVSSFGVPLRALLKMEVASWDPDECALCAKNEPVSDPGSRRLV
jgi:orotate phosphoribosyltransferase